MALADDLAAAQAKQKVDEAETARLTVASEQAQVASDAALAASKDAAAAVVASQALVSADKAEVARIQKLIDAGATSKPWLGAWPHEPWAATFDATRKDSPKVTAVRWRGDPEGRFDFAFGSASVASLAKYAAAGLRVSGNFNLRLGKSPNKTAVRLLDVAAGRYDADIIAAAKILAPFKDGDCEVMSEINVQHGPIDSQPSFEDWSLPNAEKAFVHVVDLMRANGVTIKLGTSIAGPAQMANHKAWVTPGMIKVSDFIGFDFYKKKGTAAKVNMPSLAIPVAVKAAKEMGLPLIICENGVDKTLGISAAYFSDLLATVKANPSIIGVVCTNGDKVDGPYVYDVGSPNHAPFLAMAADPLWA